MIHKIKSLFDKGNGLSRRRIAAQLKISRRTVNKYLSMTEDEITAHLTDRSREKQLDPYKEYMDQVMTQYGVVSETPFSKRGWIADPEELLEKIKQIQHDNLLLLGAYHMHRVAWPDDPRRDTPTTLDTVLAADSRMLLFIVSMVTPEQPTIRAFYEGNPDRETPIILNP